MDKGEFIKGGYTVQPGDGGSWIVHAERRHGEDGGRYTIGPTRGFTHYCDLINWLTSEHEVLNDPSVLVDDAGKPITGINRTLRGIKEHIIESTTAGDRAQGPLQFHETTEAPK